MLPRNRWFIAAALAHALLGGLVGLAWLARPGLHVLPRFIGAPIRGGWLAWAQQLLAHAGLAVFASRFLPVLGWTGAEDLRFQEGATK